MNLLLVSIDSLRLDFLSRSRPSLHTPRFDAATRHCGFCERAFSVATATRPVHASLFSGLYPSRHGVRSQRAAAMHGDAPNLFTLTRNAGIDSIGYSEAPEVFTGLNFAPYVKRLNPAADAAMAQLAPVVGSPAPQFLFLHYWSVHTPYGMPDGQAFGAVGALLRAGRIDRVRELYATAVVRLLEQKLAPLLERLPPERWAVILLSDHGEHWTADEPYHGQSLRNAVLRVPLLYHWPGTGNPPLARPLVSLVDVFPTVTGLLGLEVPPGQGTNLLTPEAAPCRMAEIDPLPPGDDLLPPSAELIQAAPGLEPQHAVFDATHKLTVWETSGKERLETTFGEEPIDAPARAAALRQAWTELPSGPHRLGSPAPPRLQQEVDRRLRDLGYL